jgi:predicted RNase H-like HicB family nuclease
MRFEVSITGDGEGGYTASCESPHCAAHGLSPINALDKLREEIRYRLELCPCTTVDDNFVELDVVSGL